MICKFCNSMVTLQLPSSWVDATGGDGCTGDDACNNENQPHVVACTVITDPTGNTVVNTGNGPWYPTCGQDAVGMRADFPMCQQHMDLFAPRPRYVARFVPQVWLGDHALDIDPRGDTEWDATNAVYALDEDYRDDLISELENEFEVLDVDDQLKDDPNAPGWVREHNGPFSIWIRKAQP